MDELFSIKKLIRQHRDILDLRPLTTNAATAITHHADGQYCFGEFDPPCRHRVEIIGNASQQGFQQALTQPCLYTTSQVSDSLPELIIYADGLHCDKAVQSMLQARNLAAMQSSSPAKDLLRNLANLAAQQGRHTTCHAVMLAVFGEGILLIGQSGIGKSGLALELLGRGHSLVADDAPLLHRPSDRPRVYAMSTPVLADLLEVRTLGVVDIVKLFGAKASTAIMPVDLVIELVSDLPACPTPNFHPFERLTNILGVDIPRLQIPVTHITNPALLLETIVKNHVLYKAGYDANRELINRQRRLLQKQTP